MDEDVRNLFTKLDAGPNCVAFDTTSQFRTTKHPNQTHTHSISIDNQVRKSLNTIKLPQPFVCDK